MKKDFNIHRDWWGPLLTLQLNSWNDLVYKPVQFLIDNNIYDSHETGDYPILKTKRIKSIFALKKTNLHKLSPLPADYENVKYFDLVADEYDMATAGFRKSIFTEVIKTLQPVIKPELILFEACCGTGTETIGLAEMLTQGKVISADLSLGMITVAFEKAKLAQHNNIIFYQQDVQQLPVEWKHQFHIVYCQLSLGYLASWKQALQQLFFTLMPDGIFISVEPNNNWYNNTAAALVKASNPDFKQNINESELNEALFETGFSSIYKKEILPGINLIMATK